MKSFAICVAGLVVATVVVLVGCKTMYYESGDGGDGATTTPLTGQPGGAGATAPGVFADGSHDHADAVPVARVGCAPLVGAVE